MEGNQKKVERRGASSKSCGKAIKNKKAKKEMKNEQMGLVVDEAANMGEVIMGRNITTKTVKSYSQIYLASASNDANFKNSSSVGVNSDVVGGVDDENEDLLRWWRPGMVVDEQMSWGSVWFPFWENKDVDACHAMYGDVLEEDLWNLISIQQAPQ